MTLPRSTLVDPSTTPYYHCISRCVRRALLCGTDSASGRSFEHRRAWIVERLAELSRIFAIEVCAYAIMSNHHHLVLKLSPRAAAAWSEDEVLERWCAPFSGPLLVQRLRAGERLSQAEYEVGHPQLVVKILHEGARDSYAANRSAPLESYPGSMN